MFFFLAILPSSMSVVFACKVNDVWLVCDKTDELLLNVFGFHTEKMFLPEQKPINKNKTNEMDLFSTLFKAIGQQIKRI